MYTDSIYTTLGSIPNIDLKFLEDAIVVRVDYRTWLSCYVMLSLTKFLEDAINIIIMVFIVS